MREEEVIEKTKEDKLLPREKKRRMRGASGGEKNIRKRKGQDEGNGVIVKEEDEKLMR